MLTISENIALDEAEIELSAIRSQGAGGQNVNKVASAIHLRFDIRASTLPESIKERLLELSDKRVTRDGVIVIKAQNHRTQEQNRADAIERLRQLIQTAAARRKNRVPTRPGVGAKKRRLDKKNQRGRLKSLRGPVRTDE